MCMESVCICFCECRGSSPGRVQDSDRGVRDPALSGGPYSGELPHLATLRRGDSVLGLLQHQHHALPCYQKTTPECQGKEKHTHCNTLSHKHTITELKCYLARAHTHAHEHTPNYTRGTKVRALLCAHTQYILIENR